MSNGDDKRNQFTFEIDPKLNLALERWRARKGLVKKDFASTALFMFAQLGAVERDVGYDRLDDWVSSTSTELPNGAASKPGVVAAARPKRKKSA